jgi:uncharacterized repeat protein (TIGR01451 family)
MKTKLLITLFLSVKFFFSYSQSLIDVKDSEFKSYLQLNFPDCFVNDLLDKDCAVKITSLSMQYMQIDNFDDIQYFTGLENLDFSMCSVSNLDGIKNLTSLKQLSLTTCGVLGPLKYLPSSLTSISFIETPFDVDNKYLGVYNNGANPNLPDLPNSLVSLTCIRCEMTWLPNLPSNLSTLICYENFITGNVYFPSSLTYASIYDNLIESIEIQSDSKLGELDCHKNKIEIIPVSLPSSLKYLNCSANSITGSLILGSSMKGINMSDNLFESIDIQSATNLIRLDCHKNKISSISGNLPNSLTYLDCSDNQLSSLPSLNTPITHLDFSTNKIHAFTIPQGSSLTFLACYDNLLDSFPALPNNLENLSCGSNPIHSLPSLPNTLKYLECSKNGLSSLPTLPNSLSLLVCDTNQLVDLPKLPSSLVELRCAGNSLTKINDLPSKLTNLDFSNNQVEILPSLPVSMKYLSFAKNRILSLDSIPKALEYLDCSDNGLKCLPYLPSKLYYLKTSLTCIPNKPNGSQTFTLNVDNTGYYSFYLPICNPLNNKNQCHAFPTVSGKIYIDENQNQIKEQNEVVCKNVKVTLQPSGYATFSNDSGFYEIAVDTLREYSISIENPKYYTSAIKSVKPTAYNQVINNDFPLYATKPVKDMSILLDHYSSIVRPGLKYFIKLDCKNLGTIPSSANLSLDFSSNFQFDSSYLSPINTKNPLLWQYNSIKQGDVKSIFIYGTISKNTVLGDTLSFTATVNSNDINDSSLVNNSYKLKIVVRSSFDPNDKQGPKTVTPKQVQNGDFIEYTIRFQNTGTDTAFNVVVSDVLTANLLPETLEMISTSHNCKTTVKGNQVYFEFLNIFLPDSNTNEVKSHGYVRFKVKPKNNLKLGQNILNTAKIYFDYNSPVITNTVNTKVDEPLITGIQIIPISFGGLAYPNPIENGRLFVSNAQGLKYKLNNMQGQPVMSGTVDETGLDVSQLNPGMYVLEFGTNENRKVEKIVIR